MNSRESLHALETSGRAQSLADLVVALLARNPDGMTRSEIDLAIASNGNSASKRLDGLEQDNRVHRSGSRRCTVTGRTATVWVYGPAPEPTADDLESAAEEALHEARRLHSRAQALEAEARDLLGQAFRRRAPTHDLPLFSVIDGGGA